MKKSSDRVAHIARSLRSLRGAMLDESGRPVSRESVASSIGVSLSSLANYETGVTTMPLDMAWELADYYGVSLDVLGGRAPRETKEE